MNILTKDKFAPMYVCAQCKEQHDKYIEFRIETPWTLCLKCAKVNLKKLRNSCDEVLKLINDEEKPEINKFEYIEKDKL